MGQIGAMQSVAFVDQVKVGTIKYQIGTLNELLGSMALDTFGKYLHCNIRHVILNHLADGQSFVPANCANAGAILAIDVAFFKMIRVGNLDMAHSNARQLNGQITAESSRAGDPHDSFTQRFLRRNLLSLVDAQETAVAHHPLAIKFIVAIARSF